MATHNEWTGDQAAQILRVIRKSGAGRQQIQATLSGGYLSDLFQANIATMNRNDFRRACGLKPISQREAQNITSLEFPTWRVLTIGDSSKDDLIAELRISDCFATEMARAVMSHPSFEVVPKCQILFLVRSRVRDLGFRNHPPSVNQVLTRAKELGLKLCPAEVGPRLRIDFLDQPIGDSIWIAMAEIKGPEGLTHVFHLWCESGDIPRLLDAPYSSTEELIGLDRVLIFHK